MGKKLNRGNKWDIMCEVKKRPVRGTLESMRKHRIGPIRTLTTARRMRQEMEELEEED